MAVEVIDLRKTYATYTSARRYCDKIEAKGYRCDLLFPIIGVRYDYEVRVYEK